MPEPVVLKIRNLTKTYKSGSGLAADRNQRVLDGVSLDLFAGECLALVGESGCGKTTLARCILRLTEFDSGEILYKGIDLVSLTAKQVRRKRADIQMIFQNPLQALNPRLRVGKCLAEALQVHHRLSGEALGERVSELFSQVGLSEDLKTRFPQELSGGQQQRVTIARALAANPSILIADEPTSSLDTILKRQIVDLLQGLQRRLGLTLLLISHDLAMTQTIANRVAAMREGRIVEVATTDRLLASPQHAYTSVLLAAARRDLSAEYV